MSPRGRGAAAAGCVFIAAGILALRVCDLMFACGCNWPWWGAATHCNAFAAKAMLHCPWCVHPWAGYGLIGLSALAGAIAAFVGDERGRINPSEAPPPAFGVMGRPARPRGRPRAPIADLVVRTLAGVGVFLLLCLAAGWVTALATGYPRFLGLR